MIEYFDVVDEHDQPTGERTTKPEAHANGTWHRCAAVFVFAEDGRLYVQEHKSNLLDHTVGGHVQAGEGYEEAAAREADEEIRLTQPLQPVALSVPSDELFNPAEQTTHQRHQFGIFECQPDASWRFSPTPDVQRLQLMTLEEVVHAMHENPGRFTPGFIITMATYLKVKQVPIKLNLEACKRNWSVQ
jgi:isopentenyldiphosphate isomerase